MEEAIPTSAAIPKPSRVCKAKPKVEDVSDGERSQDGETGSSSVASSGAAISNGGKTKRGRKPKQVYMCQDNGFEGSARCHSDDENVVLNLKVCGDIASFDNETDPVCPPDAYDFKTTTAFFSKPFELDPQDSMFDNEVCVVPPHNPLACDAFKCASSTHPTNKQYRVVNLLKDFEERNKANEWPSTTSIHCYWCCHKFKNVPFGIPIKYADNKFHVFGCFCSLECAAAHNMHHHDSVDEMWERYMLINMLSRKLEHRDIVKPAPSRLALKAFGGHMDIDEFREYFHTNKVINVNFPPMMTLTQQLEEVNEGDITSDLKYIPIDTDRINKYKEKMKLRRTKPIANFRNTLDHTMNLKITA